MSESSMENQTIFVDNLPHQIRKIWIYNLFSKFGKIRDIFIPNKKSKTTGQSFGFVRYNGKDEADFAITEVNNSWFWGQKLIVHYARYQRNYNKKFNRTSKYSVNYPKNWRRKGEGTQNSMHVRFNRSAEQRGKEIWRRKGVVETSKQGEARNAMGHDDADKVFDKSPESNYPDGNVIKTQAIGGGWLRRSVIAKIRRLLSPKDLETVFLKEEIQDIQVRAIGGRFVIITFSDTPARDAALKLDWTPLWFEEFKPWEGEQAKLERFVWLSCIGMPLNGWSVPTFREIGNKWGHFLQVDENTLNMNSFDKARVLISTEKSQRIEGNIMVVIEGKGYDVRVEEDDSFRVIKHSLYTNTTFGRDHVVDGDDMDDDEGRDVEQKRDELESNANVEDNNNSEENNNDKQVPNELQGINNHQLQPNSDGVQFINENVNTENSAMSSSSEFETLAADSARAIECEKVLDSLDGLDYQEGSLNSEELETTKNLYQQPQHSDQLKNLMGDNWVQEAKGKENEVSSGGGSRIMQVPRLAIKHMETILEEEVESFVGETPCNEVNNQLEPFEINENSNHKEFPEEYWKVAIEHNQREPLKQQPAPKVLTARQKRARLRKDIRDICDSLDKGTQVGDVWEDVSVHSDSIDSEDILRRNNIIFQDLEEELQSQIAMGERLGIEFSEEDTVMMAKMIKDDANRYASLSRSKSKI